MNKYEEHTLELANELTSIDPRYRQQINLKLPTEMFINKTSSSETSQNLNIL